MAKSDGAKILEARDGPQVEHDKLISEILDRAAEQHARSSDASESAAKVAKFLEDTALNSQAYSWMSSVIKKLPKKDGQHKAMDVIRSLKVLLPMIEAHVAGQGTGEMNLGKPEDAQPEGDDTPADNSTVTPIEFGGQAAE